jgi:hypothetical protein
MSSLAEFYDRHVLAIVIGYLVVCILLWIAAAVSQQFAVAIIWTFCAPIGIGAGFFLAAISSCGGCGH